MATHDANEKHDKAYHFQAPVDWNGVQGFLVTFRFAEDRIIPRFHLEGVEAGQRVSVFKIDADTGERLGLLATAAVGEGGWVDVSEPIIVRAGDAFIVVQEPPA